MQILLVAASELEIAPFLAQNPVIDHLITGVGSPSTIYHLTKRLQQIDYDLVIQAGIAGSFAESPALGEIVLVAADNFADLGITEKGNFYTIFEKGFADENIAPFTNGWLKADDEILKEFSVQKVRAITVNTVTDEKNKIATLTSKFNPQIETMEGAALHFVCLQENMPFLQLRSISNFVGERDKTKWKTHEAIDRLNQALGELVGGLRVEH